MRYLNAAQDMILGDDGANISVDPRSKEYADLIAAGTVIEPYQRWPDLEAARADLIAEAETHARRLRVAIAGTSDATKLAVYREKYDVAIAALAGDATALAVLASEASARGESGAALAALVKSLGDSWRSAGLAIDVACQRHKAAIAALARLADADLYDPTAGWPA